MRIINGLCGLLFLSTFSTSLIAGNLVDLKAAILGGKEIFSVGPNSMSKLAFYKVSDDKYSYKCKGQKVSRALADLGVWYGDYLCSGFITFPVGYITGKTIGVTRGCRDKLTIKKKHFETPTKPVWIFKHRRHTCLVYYLSNSCERLQCGQYVQKGDSVNGSWVLGKKRADEIWGINH